MKTKIGAICAFIEENPSHSKYNIQTVSESLVDLPDFKMLVISNGCKISDSVKEYLSSQPHILFLELSMNIGVPAAWNLGIDLLDCDYMFFLNDDLWVDEYCIAEILGVFKEKPDSAVVGVEGVRCSKLGQNGFPETDKRYRKNKRRFLLKKKIIDVTAVSGFLFAVNMDFVRGTRFRFDSRFSPAFLEEFDLAFFARKHGYKARIILGLDKHYDHSFGISSATKKIHYLGSTICTDELSERNVRRFCEKWDQHMIDLIKPQVKVVYNESFFLPGWFKNWEELKHVLKELIMYNPTWKDIFDFGCGPGVMIDFMNDAGFNYVGCDYSPNARELYLEKHGAYPEKYLTELPEDKNIDLFLSFDVFEHMTDEEIMTVLDKVKQPAFFLFNISREKGIPGHINLKSDREWIRFFSSRKLQFLQDDTMNLRSLYLKKRGAASDLWDKNLFLFRSVS
jgi:GT2 family glycosyltransferase